MFKQWRLRFAWWLIGAPRTGDWMCNGKIFGSDRFSDLQELEAVLSAIRDLIYSNPQVKAVVPINLEIALNRALNWPLSIRSGKWTAFFDALDGDETCLFLHGPGTGGSIGMPPDELAPLIKKAITPNWDKREKTP
jgi:hypothetical protein